MRKLPVVRGMCLLLCLVVSGFDVRAAELAFKADVLDEANSGMWRDGEVVADKVEQLLPVLGVTNVVPTYIGWTAGRVAEEGTPSEFVYRVAFKRPVAVGAIFLTGSMREVFVLKAGVDGPGDLKDRKSVV